MMPTMTRPMVLRMELLRALLMAADNAKMNRLVAKSFICLKEELIIIDLCN